MLQKIRASVNTHRVQKKSTITTFGRTFESFERLVPSSSFQNKMNSAGHQKKKNLFSHNFLPCIYFGCYWLWTNRKKARQVHRTPC